MAIVTFCSNEIKETGQTLSLSAVATYMAIEHNYKILVISTDFNDLSLENCFWEYDKIRTNGAIRKDQNIGIESGIEGLIKALKSNRTSNEIIKNYSRIVLKDRLDILLSPATKSYQEYTEIVEKYVDILQVAKRYYDLIFIDLSKKMPRKDAAAILKLSDIVVINMTQRLKTINDFATLRQENDFYQRRNVMLLVGIYDRNSKYNTKNITRYLKEKKLVSAVPYNTLFLEACSEGNIIEFMLRAKNVTDESDTNNIFIKEIKSIDEGIIFKLQELQMKI